MSDASKKDKECAGEAEAEASPEGTHGPHKRYFRNYLLDKRFQLKYTSIVVAVTTVLSGVLGYFLYNEIVLSQETILASDLGESQHLIEPGDHEARQVVADQIDEEFFTSMRDRSRVLVRVNLAPPEGAIATYEEDFEHEVLRKTSTLALALGVFLLILAVFWVYLTHQIAGPVWKLRILFSRVTGENLRVVGSLRKGDELQEAFVSFSEMIGRLQEHRREQAATIRAIIDRLEDHPDKAADAAEALRQHERGLLGSIDDTTES